MAMAAKDFVANIFGGITVFIDKPFGAGDRIKVNGIDGTVQEIGIRSTRIQTLENRLVTIPNHQFTDQVVENVTAEPSRKMKVVLGLTYDTTPDQIEEALRILTEIVSDAGRTEDEYTVWFSGFGDFSLNVSAIYFIRKGEHWAHVPNEINLQILRRFNEAGLEFAFPTQTLIHEGCHNRDIFVMGMKRTLLRPQHLDQMNQYDVVIRMSEPRYWVLLVLSFLAGLALIRRFKGLQGASRDRALKQMGWVLLVLQIGYQIRDVVGSGLRVDLAQEPAAAFLWHQHLAGRAELLLETQDGVFVHGIHGNDWRVSRHPDAAIDRGRRLAHLDSLLHQPRGACVCADCDVSVLWDAVSQMGMGHGVLHRCGGEHCHGGHQHGLEHLRPWRRSGELHVHDGAAQGGQSVCVPRFGMAVVCPSAPRRVDVAPHRAQCAVPLALPRRRAERIGGGT